ncbi:hypothetical protein [Arthrobacter sp. StoSoilB13]|uniref:hypothetical protein n=1 Tax=Arthrobacter sp. StoSoilB13 TaxID=2830993 RepID=UPI001E7B6260|nr:hypothetical protein StoSoilB13_42430 [Arthrobacter sp. StoSoilB13]
MLAYRSDGSWVSVDAAMINEYLRGIAGAAYTSKDFRTWKGTAAAALSLLKSEGTMTRPQALVKAMKDAAQLLGNTPTVARTSYVDPRIVEAYLSGELQDVKPTEASIAAFLIGKQSQGIPVQDTKKA